MTIKLKQNIKSVINTKIVRNWDVPGGRSCASSQQTGRWYLVRIETIIINKNYDSWWHSVEPLPEPHNPATSLASGRLMGILELDSKLVFSIGPLRKCVTFGKRCKCYSTSCVYVCKTNDRTRSACAGAYLSYLNSKSACGNVSNVVGEIVVELIA